MSANYPAGTRVQLIDNEGQPFVAVVRESVKPGEILLKVGDDPHLLAVDEDWLNVWAA